MSNVDLSRYSRRIVQLFWDPEPKRNDHPEYPIWCLGRKYGSADLDTSTTQQQRVQSGVVHLSPELSPPATSVISEDVSSYSGPSSDDFDTTLREDVDGSVRQLDGEDWPAQFLDDIGSRLWFTYRSGFASIAKSADPKATSSMSLAVRWKSQLTPGGFASDTGWGCMIRSGQSLLANAMLFSRLGRDWTRQDSGSGDRDIISMFADDPRAPFSIHKFVEHGAAACGVFPGQWFGPSATAKCIQWVRCDQHHTCLGDAGLRVYVTGDGSDLFEDELYQVAQDEEHQFRPTLLLVGTRLGIDRVTPAYREALKTSLQMPQSVGIAGGRPSASHYFVGVQGTSYFYLDPHFTRPALPLRDNHEEYSCGEIDSCYTRRLRRIAVEEMDPSMLIGFLFQDEAEWKTWRKTVGEAPGRAIFHVADSRPPVCGAGTERGAAVDEVQTFDDDE